MDPSLAPLPADRLTRPQARHLLRRTGFGATEKQVRRLVELAPADAAEMIVGQLAADDAWPAIKLDPDVISPPTPDMQRLFVDARRTEDQQKLLELQRLQNEARRDDRLMLGRLQRWWLGRMIGSDTPLRENLVLLWHSHFATRHRDVRDAYLLHQQQQTFRASPARFDTLARAIVRDPAMLRFLNNDRNSRRRPNENLARELMELFTLGVGNYVEDDIHEGARALTGYHVHDNDFQLNERDHDDRTKTILGSTGPFDGDGFVELLLRRKACPRFVALKLYDHFVLDVADHPEQAQPVSRVVIDRMAGLIARHDYDLRPVLTMLLASRHFHDPQVVGQKVKSPASLVVGTARTLATPDRDLDLLLEAMRLMGQTLFDPPSVAGWPGGPAWINTSTLFIRQNTAAYLLTGQSPQQRRHSADTNGYDPTPLLHDADIDPQQPPAVVDHLVNQLLGDHIAADRRQVLTDYLAAHRAEPDTLVNLLLLITAMPEFQLC